MSETTTVPLGQLHRNDYNPRFIDGDDVDEEDIESLAQSISQTGELATALTVRPNPNGEGYEVIAGERRLLALRSLYDESHTVEVSIRDVDDETAEILAFEENRERKDISPMSEAKWFAQRVTVEVDSEPQTYTEYVNNLWILESTDDLHVLGKNYPDVKRLGETVSLSEQTISERLRLLLLPEKAQQWIDDGGLTKRAARMIIRKVNTKIDDPQDALDMMADLAQTYGPDYGGMSNDDYDALKNDIETRTSDYERRKEIAEEEVEGFRDLVFERLDKLAEELEHTSDEFNVSAPISAIPDDVDSPRDIDFEAIKDGVEECRDELQERRKSLTDRIDESERKADQLQTETGRMKQAIQHFDEEEEACPYCQQVLDPAELRETIRQNSEEIDELRSDVHRHDDHLDDLSSARKSLHRDVQRIEGALESYDEAYETAMEFGDVEEVDAE